MMKNLMLLFLVGIMAGCATTSQVDVRVQELEKRMAKIESDLYEPVREKKVMEAAYKPYKLKNTEPIKRILDETNKIETFCGYRFGDVAPESYRKQLYGCNEHAEELKMPFRVFQRVNLGYTQVYTRLHMIFLQRTMKEISTESVEEEIVKIKDVLERKFGIEMSAVSRKPQYKEFSCNYSGRGVQIRLWSNGQSNNGAGFWLKVECPRIVDEDKIRANQEAKKFSIPEGVGADVL